jgi:diguanylate cyclase (GGDEF)-like protein
VSKILVVDDDATGRKALVTLLRYEGHDILEASDGADGLKTAQRYHPQLIISDILMPSMDGYEFVRRLRTDQELATTAVIFYTASYHQGEAQALATKCQVDCVIAKPSPARDLLRAVESLIGAGSPLPSPADPDFDTEHLRLLTDKLARTADDLRAANKRLAALIELNTQLASVRDPQRLLDQVCSGARSLLGASFGVLAVADRLGSTCVLTATSGLESHSESAQPQIDAGALGTVATQSRAIRMRKSPGSGLKIGLPAGYPEPQALVAAPIRSLTRVYGWICLVDKSGADEFDSEDERLLTILGAQVGRIYENGSLYTKVQYLNRVHSMLSGVNALIVRANDRRRLLNDACRIAIDPGKFGAAWCGLIDPSGEIHTVAAAGDLAHMPSRWQQPPAEPGLAHAAHSDSPIIATMHTQQPVICNELTQFAANDDFRAQLRTAGYRAVVALPLVAAGTSIGCLVLATRESGLFDEEEMHLLTELADDLSFALDHIDKSEQLNYLANHDALTGLPNRALFKDRLAQLVSVAEPESTGLAVIIADPERLASFNETIGRAATDQLLQELANRLVSCVGAPDRVGRLGSDQFAAVITGLRSRADVPRTVEQLCKQWLAAPFVVQEQAIRVTAKAGVAIFPVDGEDAEALLRNAETALKTAKISGKAFAAYTARLSEELTARVTLERNLRQALERGEFVLHYQPKVELKSRKLQGLEALIRWNNPELGLVAPARFIPMIEENGLVVEVGTWALRQASLDRARWLQQKLNPPRVAVNVSTVQLRRDDFVGTVDDIVAAAGADCGLDIEVTESVLMADVADNLDRLAAICARGVNIALDDFGTGYSSLSYLARLPVHALKIDRSFIASMLDDPSAMTLVSTIISLARALKLQTIAEGVESEEQAKILRLLQCDQMQGYLICEPLSAQDMTAYLAGSTSPVRALSS